MEIEWLVTDVTVVGSSSRAVHAIWGVILARLVWPIQATFLVGAPLCDVVTLS